EFAFNVGRLLVQRHPDTLTQEFLKVDRSDRIFVDTGRNGLGATVAAPYAVRAKPGAPVSAPCSWEEVERGDALPQSFRLRDLAARLDSISDPWSDMRRRAHSLRRPAERLAKLLGPDAPPLHEGLQDRFGRRLNAKK